MKKIIGILAVLIVIGGIVAFSQSGKDTANNTASGDTPAKTEPAQSGSTSTEAAPADAQATNMVTISNFKFGPKNITVKKGTTVTWVNKDSVAHTVTADNMPGPDSPLMGEGESYSYKFDNTGSHPYFCKPHTYMKASVTVTD